jgi:hypothetical protein
MAREVVEETLKEYVEFFNRFAETPLPYQEVKKLKDSHTWQDEFLINKLQVSSKGNEIQLKQGIDLMTSKLIQPYKECTTSLREFARPDARLREVVTGRTTLWEVKEDESHIKEGYDRIESVIEMNLENAKKSLELYDPFVFLLDEDARVTAFAEDISKNTKGSYICRDRDTLFRDSGSAAFTNGS